MHCPFCSFEETKVIDSRLVDECDKVKRRARVHTVSGAIYDL